MQGKVKQLFCLTSTVLFWSKFHASLFFYHFKKFWQSSSWGKVPSKVAEISLLLSLWATWKESNLNIWLNYNVCNILFLFLVYYIVIHNIGVHFYLIIYTWNIICSPSVLSPSSFSLFLYPPDPVPQLYWSFRSHL